jgi:phenol/toluene 2-monooxygenase (NADH) P1/A1
MSNIDLRTVSIKPLRHTFSHVAARIGGDKPASRYQEATFDLQSTINFQYRTTWAPESFIFDAARTKVVMKDWYAFKDPRQYYYATYTMARGKMQQTAEDAFAFVEGRGLVGSIPAPVKQLTLDVLVPLRHVAWGSNMNNASITAYGHGAAITNPSIFQAMDQLGVAQYLSRIGLLLGDVAALDAGKQAWMEHQRWQALRCYVEDTFVLPDWFELFVAQNFVQDGLLYPLVYDGIVDDAIVPAGGAPVAQLTNFMVEWYAETTKWVDSVIKAAAAESPANKELLSKWTRHWRKRAIEALEPIAQHALGDVAQATLDDHVGQFDARAAKLGLVLTTPAQG